MDMSDVPTSAVDERRARWPAWGLSLVLHLVVMLGLALTLRTVTRSDSSEPPRDVGIVLAQRNAEQQVNYFDQRREAETETAPATDVPAATAPAVGGADGAAPALPAAADMRPLLAPDIQLPGAAITSGPSEDLLVHGLSVRGRGRQPVLPGLDDAAILAEDAARRAAGKARGPTTRVSLFGSPAAQGRSFVFAVDRSKSMGGDGLNALAAAREQLVRALAALQPSHQFQIIAYNHTCTYFRGTRLVPANAENTAAVGPFIDGLADYGGTLHDMVVRAALAMEPEALFVLTDGGDPHLNDIQLRNIQKLAAGQTAIHSIQFGFGPLAEEDNFLMALARQNGGGYTYVDMARRPASGGR